MMVLWILMRNKSHLSPFEIFRFSLSILDMLFCISILVADINFLFLKNINFFGGPLYRACLCVDRYIAVLHPITYMTFKGPRYRMACSAVAWIITLSLCTLQSLHLIRFDEIEGIAAFYIVVPVMGFCNISILRALRQSGPGSEGIHPMKKKAFKTVLVILLIMLVNYLPSIATFTFKP
ncbi:GPR35 protein, partial [Amia calva]|nr:GPR35 protein [Amia calva]